jgi:predicted  nucleic acid-binding Zn-ribbon protein
MKKSGLLLIMLIGFLAVFILYLAPITQFVGGLLVYSPCDKPIPYRIDTIDPRFHVSFTEFKDDINQATNIWDSSVGKELFTYDEGASLSISLIYDKRQALTTQINEMQDQLQKEKNSLDPAISDFQNREAEFNKRVQELNNQINYWNSQGGAPPDDYNKLIQERAALQQEAQNLNQKAKELNQSTHLYNTEVGQLNTTVDSFNKVLAKKPEEGLYDGKADTITIYFSTNKDELIHTLAHELGHARGMDHNPDENSIMYAYTTRVIKPSAIDLSDLQQICAKRSIFVKMQNNLRFLIQVFTNRSSE